MKDLIFNPLEVCCPHCSARIVVSLEALDDNEIFNCSECDYSFDPKIDVDALLDLMKKIEKE